MESTDKDFAGRLAFWEKRFPGKGVALMDILGPFYGWKPELKPALPDLEARVNSAVHWRRVKGVGVFKASLDVSLLASLRASLGVSFRNLLWASLHTTLGASLEASLSDSLRFSLGPSLWASLDDKISVSLSISSWTTIWTSIGPDLRYAFSDSLRKSCLFACGFILAGKPEDAAKFQPLLNLWLAGNFPVGFDRDGNLLVLVAD